MSPLFYVVFALACILGVVLLACIRIADLADERHEHRDRMPLPTARQLRRWRKERLDLNPALRGRR